MIKDEVFKKTEGMLYRYFKNKRDVEMINYKILTLKNKKNKLEHILKTTEIEPLHCIGGDIQGISYEGERIQTSGSKESYFEKTLMKEIRNIEKDYIDTMKKILKLDWKVAEKETKISEVEYILDQLNEEARTFIDLYYGERYSFRSIARELHISKSTAERRRGEVIKDVAKIHDYYGTKLGQSWGFIA